MKYERESAVSVHEKYRTPTSCLTVARPHPGKLFVSGPYGIGLVPRRCKLIVWTTQPNLLKNWLHAMLARSTSYLCVDSPTCMSHTPKFLFISFCTTCVGGMLQEYACTEHFDCLNMPGINLTLLSVY